MRVDQNKFRFKVTCFFGLINNNLEVGWGFGSIILLKSHHRLKIILSLTL